MTNGTFTEYFKPAWWLPGGHSQTLWRKFSPPTSIIQKRQRIELDDGDFIDLDWADPISVEASYNRTIVIITHGLCGCSSSPYVLALQTMLCESDIASAAINFRGCSGEFNRLATAYHSGISADINQVFERLSTQYPNHNFAFVGYSLGANVLLKWLGELQHSERIAKAVAVSTPFSLALCSQAMLTGLSRLYGSYFVRRLRHDVAAKKHHFTATGNDSELQRLVELGELDNISTIWEFDDRVTAPLHGFLNAEDYYTRSSSRQYLAAIKTDTLLIQSRNDPMIPLPALPLEQELPANVRMQLSQHGGHVGFICGHPDNWLERRIVSFVRAD